MRKSIYTYAILLALPVIALMTSCEPKALEEEDLFLTEAQVAEFTADGTVYHLDDFLDTFMDEKEGNFKSDSSLYRTRTHKDEVPDVYLFTLDTLPTDGPGIYIRGRISTDDYAGNFYKAMVIQEIVNGEQQNLRVSMDLGSSGGLYQIGQEIVIRCNGLAIGRYANQPQLCVPSYNNNLNASHADEKTGWAPGRIPGPVFRNVAKMIGTPDKSKLQYKEVTLAELYAIVDRAPALTIDGMKKVWKQDGMLVRIKDVHFSGEYVTQKGKLENCDTNHPDSSENVNVFAPTTLHKNYPQGRVVKDAANNAIVCSTSEFAKYAHFYLPGADKNGVDNCANYVGTVTGILGWYFDTAKYLPTQQSGDDWNAYQYKWAISPRGIPGFGVADIQMFNQTLPWVPQEYGTVAN